MTIRVGIIGGSGYTGGELLRLIAVHPGAELAWVTSRSRVGWPIGAVHPNLRGFLDDAFISPDDIEPCNVLFLCLPHGATAGAIETYAGLAERIVDLSADFRLRDSQAYEATYGEAHPAPDWLDRFVYGLPEVMRDELRGAQHASGVGCNATAVTLALLPLVRAGLIDGGPIVADVKVGSSEAGAAPSASGHHPQRAGAVRTFAPTSHRHEAETRQSLGDLPLHFTATAIELVRGVLATCHVFTNRELTDRDLRQIYRDAYADEPFVRIVSERRGLYRLPEPKIVAGTNYADVGFAAQAGTNRVVALCAIDNLGKGAAGSAMQSMNLMCGFDETAGLRSPGLHPV